MSGSALTLQRRIQVLCAELAETELALTRVTRHDDRRTTMLDLPTSAPRREPDAGSSDAHSLDVWAEANARSDRTREAIRDEHARCFESPRFGCQHDRDLARLDSDLASLRDAFDGLAKHEDAPCWGHCSDAARYARQRDRALTELDRTATAYGVTT